MREGMMANLFRMTQNGRLDREYLRLCAVYRLLKNGKIDKRRAIELTGKRSTVETWSLK